MPGASLQTAPGAKTEVSSISCLLGTPQEIVEGRGWERPGKEQRQARRELYREGSERVVHSVQTGDEQC